VRWKNNSVGYSSSLVIYMSPPLLLRLLRYFPVFWVEEGGSGLNLLQLKFNPLMKFISFNYCATLKIVVRGKMNDISIKRFIFYLCAFSNMRLPRYTESAWRWWVFARWLNPFFHKPDMPACPAISGESPRGTTTGLQFPILPVLVTHSDSKDLPNVSGRSYHQCI